VNQVRSRIEAAQCCSDTPQGYEIAMRRSDIIASIGIAAAVLTVAVAVLRIFFNAQTDAFDDTFEVAWLVGCLASIGLGFAVRRSHYTIGLVCTTLGGLLLFVAMLLPAMTPARGSGPHPPRPGSADAFIRDWADTFNENRPDELLAFYDRSEQLDVILSSGVRLRGYKAVEKVYREDQNIVRHYDSGTKELSTRILGDTALVTFEHLYKFRSLEDDSRWQVHVRTTTVLHWKARRWRIVLEHSSPIHGIERMERIEEQ